MSLSSSKMRRKRSENRTRRWDRKRRKKQGGEENHRLFSYFFLPSSFLSSIVRGITIQKENLNMQTVKPPETEGKRNQEAHAMDYLLPRVLSLLFLRLDILLPVISFFPPIKERETDDSLPSIKLSRFNSNHNTIIIVFLADLWEVPSRNLSSSSSLSSLLPAASLLFWWGYEEEGVWLNMSTKVFSSRRNSKERKKRRKSSLTRMSF